MESEECMKVRHVLAGIVLGVSFVVWSNNHYRSGYAAGYLKHWEEDIDREIGEVMESVRSVERNRPRTAERAS